MKRAIFLLLSILLLTVTVLANNGNVPVYITKTGECYHRDQCSYLHSKIEITLEKAVARGYRRCSRCKPPILDDAQPTDRDPYMTAAERREREAVSRMHDEQLEKAAADAETARQEADAAKQELAAVKKKVRNSCILIFAAGVPLYWWSSSRRIRNAQKQAAENAVAVIRQELEIQQKALMEARQQTAVPLPPPVQTILPQAPPKQGALPAPPPAFTSSGDLTYLRAAYQELYEGKSIREITGVSPDIRFDQNDYPHSDKRDMEARFIVYVTPSGKSYHTAKCSSARTGKPVHICVARMQGKGPCDRCRPLRDLPPEIKEYQRIIRICRKFKIDIKP